MLSLFNSPHNYMKQPVFESVQPIDEYGTAVFQLNDLRPGTYAFNVIYDEDSDGKLDTGFLGIPTEKVGFSNQARGSFGPPKFNKASFQLEADTTMKITFTGARD